MKFQLDNTVTFSGDIVVRQGKVFECGLYKDKVKNGVAFSLSIEEADHAIANFSPSDVGDEHIKGSWATGLLGKMQKVWRKGKEIFAEFHIPKALHDLLKGAPVPVSTIWDEDKMLVGCDLTGDPRITDAIMTYTFNRAVEDKVYFTAEDVSELLTFTKEKHATEKEKPNMGFWDKMKTLFKESNIHVEDTEDVIDPSGVVHTTEKVKVEDTAEFKAQKSEADTLKAELEALKAEKEVQFKSDNQAKITEYLTIGKLTKAEEAEALTDRAKNPELYDKAMLRVPVIAEFRTVDSNDESLNVDPNKDAKVTVKSNIENLPNQGWL